MDIPPTFPLERHHYHIRLISISDGNNQLEFAVGRTPRAIFVANFERPDACTNDGLAIRVFHETAYELLRWGGSNAQLFLHKRHIMLLGITVDRNLLLFSFVSYE